MSDMTPCNYCTLQAIKRREQEVVLKPGKPSHGLPAGVEVYVRRGNKLEKVAWFMALSKHCAC